MNQNHERQVNGMPNLTVDSDLFQKIIIFKLNERSGKNVIKFLIFSYKLKIQFSTMSAYFGMFVN